MHFKDRKSKKVKSIWTILIVNIGIIILIVTVFCDEVFAGSGRAIQSSPAFSPKGTPIPPTFHPVVPPPQFFNKWSVTEIIDSFQKNELEIANIKPVTEEDYGSLPSRPEEGIKFFIPSIREDVAGCILSFGERYDLEKVKKYYQSLNKKGKLYSWTFVKDNILLVLDGTLPEAVAREFEKVLNDLKK